MFGAKKYNMNISDADKMLQNVFAACEMEPNDTELEVIKARSIAEATVVRVGKIIAYVFLGMLLISPLAFYGSRIQPSDNLTVNGRKSEAYVIEHHLEGKVFTLTLGGSDVSYEGIYCKKDNGDVVVPSDYDETTGVVHIPFDGEEINIFIPCKDGSVKHAILTQN